MDNLEQKLRRARANLEPAWDQDRASRVAAGIGPRKRRQRMARALAVGAIAAAALSVVLFTSRRELSSPDELTLADGSVVTLRAGAKVARLVDSQGRVHLELMSGRARFVVTHDKSRPFRVDAGPVTVEVIGTRFEIDRQPTATNVSVEEGRVAVTSRLGRNELGAGESATFEVSVTATVDAPPVPPAPAVPAVAVSPKPAPPRPTPSAPIAVAKPKPHVETASALLALADAARQAGRDADAEAPLQRLLATHPDDPQAPIAAFTLGRLLLERLNRPAEAADAFARAQKALPLREDALAREVEAAARAGDKARARERADVYSIDFPHGPHLRNVRRLGGWE